LPEPWSRRTFDLVTENADVVMESRRPTDPRLERVLDSAAELLLRWGYQRVTIDEIARHAGIGKGTVYLHFPTKEALFLTMLLRAQRRSISAVLEQMLADPAEALLSRVCRSVYEHVVADPVLRVLYLGDLAVLGRLANEAAETLGELAAVRAEAVRLHIRLLREAGCLRTDLDVDAQLHVLQAVTSGIFFAEAMPGVPEDPRHWADLMAYTVAAALEIPDPPLDGLTEVLPQLAARYAAVIEKFDEEWRNRVR
jgi:AcrR family transcriptional regulator